MRPEKCPSNTRLRDFVLIVEDLAQRGGTLIRERAGTRVQREMLALHDVPVGIHPARSEHMVAAREASNEAITQQRAAVFVPAFDAQDAVVGRGLDLPDRPSVFER